VKLHAPAPLAVVVPARTPSTYTETVAFASAVPLTVGVVSFVKLPSAGALTTGAEGAVVSTVNVLVFEFPETFPAASVAVARAVWLPSASAEAGVKLQAPAPLVVVVPASTPST
jgi:hypothetical protein